MVCSLQIPLCACAPTWVLSWNQSFLKLVIPLCAGALPGLAWQCCLQQINTEDRGSWGTECTNKHSWHCKQAACAYSRRCEAPHLFLLLEHLGAARVVQSISCPIPFWMFLFPCVGCSLKRKTWIYAILFPEIQEKEMGLLNKIALIWEFLRAGCAFWQRCLCCEQSCPRREAQTVGSTMQGWGLLWQLAWQG